MHIDRLNEREQYNEQIRSVLKSSGMQLLDKQWSDGIQSDKAAQIIADKFVREYSESVPIDPESIDAYGADSDSRTETHPTLHFLKPVQFIRHHRPNQAQLQLLLSAASSQSKYRHYLQFFLSFPFLAPSRSYAYSCSPLSISTQNILLRLISKNTFQIV